MSEIRDLIRAMALTQAYAAAGNDGCYSCGLPKTRIATKGPWYKLLCDSCKEPDGYEARAEVNAPAVRRLMAVARGE